MSLRIGVLALQGDFAEHAAIVRRCGATACEIRRSAEIADIDGLIIPGGESTAIDKLMADNQDPIFDTILSRGQNGMPIYGTCMGSIFLAKEIEGSTQGRLALMDICVKRNAFGPQRFSFETLLDIPVLGPQSFPAVFIRGPIIKSVSSDVEVLSSIDEGIVMARQKNLLVTAFHPEITDDLRVHQLFLSMVSAAQKTMPVVK
jgi:5'-phosphate synthase pdxT subunit